MYKNIYISMLGDLRSHRRPLSSALWDCSMWQVSTQSNSSKNITSDQNKQVRASGASKQYERLPKLAKPFGGLCNRCALDI